MFLRINLLLVALVIAGCADWGYQEKYKDVEVKWENIQRVHEHQGLEYTFMVGDTSKVTLVPIKLCVSSNFTEVIFDVPKGKPMWAKATRTKYRETPCYCKLEIHVHGPEDIVGAPAEVGK